ncbi:MAG TPA: hypothetical protein VK477_02270 [Acidobacteriota bacterium]|nr:hypothetical protein [Acidobacteriota bacterium]
MKIQKMKTVIFSPDFEKDAAACGTSLPVLDDAVVTQITANQSITHARGRELPVRVFTISLTICDRSVEFLIPAIEQRESFELLRLIAAAPSGVVAS